MINNISALLVFRLSCYLYKIPCFLPVKIMATSKWMKKRRIMAKIKSWMNKSYWILIN